MLVIQFSSLNDLRDFVHMQSLFFLWYPHSKKSQKRRQKITVFNLASLYLPVIVLFLSFVGISQLQSG